MSIDTSSQNTSFRQYEDDENDRVAAFYAANHTYQTLAFARAKQAQYGQKNLKQMGIWEACQWLDTLVDESDPDTELSQMAHLLQTAEAIRAAGEPRWLQLTGLIHDLGKVLCLVGEPQWAVVGDTFPLGCKFSDQIVYPRYFERNPDYQVSGYQTEYGIYSPHCGLDQVTMSWGHDEYLYLVTRDYLPPPALYILRYHSFYAAHSRGAYQHLMNEEDQEMFAWVRHFQPFDLYSKATATPSGTELAAYYQDLVSEYFPATLRW